MRGDAGGEVDAERFDRLVASLTHSGSRRGVLHTLAGVALGTVGLRLDAETAGARQGGGRRKRQDGNGRNRRRNRGARSRARAPRSRCCRGNACTPGAGKNLGQCCYEGRNLAGKSFKGANLGGANFSGATLTKANFTSANLDKACFVDANLRGARIAGANTGTAIFCRTTMPDGSINNAGCGKGTSCCPTCDGPCPGGQQCCGNGSCQECCTNAHCASGVCCRGACCEDGSRCIDGACSACVPDCEDRACGSDGCDGTCGDCTAPDTCDTSTGQCVCVPDCAGNRCGDDGCGGACPDCGPCQACGAEGVCEPLPNGTVCGARAFDGGALRCCNGACYDPDCVPVNGVPRAGACCCSNGQNTTRPALCWVTSRQDCPNTSGCPPLDDRRTGCFGAGDGELSCASTCQEGAPGCFPCLGCPTCGTSDETARCASDKDCSIVSGEPLICLCGVCTDATP